MLRLDISEILTAAAGVKIPLAIVVSVVVLGGLRGDGDKESAVAP